MKKLSTKDLAVLACLPKLGTHAALDQHIAKDAKINVTSVIGRIANLRSHGFRILAWPTDRGMTYAVSPVSWQRCLDVAGKYMESVSSCQAGGETSSSFDSPPACFSCLTDSEVME